LEDAEDSIGEVDYIEELDHAWQENII
jgi:hypothetical protein